MEWEIVIKGTDDACFSGTAEECADFLEENFTKEEIDNLAVQKVYK